MVPHRCTALYMLQAKFPFLIKQNSYHYKSICFYKFSCVNKYLFSSHHISLNRSNPSKGACCASALD